MKRKLASLLVVVLVLGLLVGCGSSATVDDSSSGNSGSKKEETKQDLTNLKVGTTIDLDGVKITVNSFGAGKNDLTDKPTKMASVTYKNESDKSVSYNSYDWKSENADGVRKDNDSFVTDDKKLDTGDLAKGGTITGNVYFDDTTMTKVVFVPNFFSNDEELIFWNVAQ